MRTHTAPLRRAAPRRVRFAHARAARPRSGRRERARERSEVARGACDEFGGAKGDDERRREPRHHLAARQRYKRDPCARREHSGEQHYLCALQTSAGSAACGCERPAAPGSARARRPRTGPEHVAGRGHGVVERRIERDRREARAPHVLLRSRRPAREDEACGVDPCARCGVLQARLAIALRVHQGRVSSGVRGALTAAAAAAAFTVAKVHGPFRSGARAPRPRRAGALAARAQRFRRRSCTAG